MTSLFCPRALLPDGWADDVLLEIDRGGTLAAVLPGATVGAAERAAGVVLPGMPNLHSHAFQRAMAGLTEKAGLAPDGTRDSFWTWRDVMYGFVGRLGPEQVQAIACQLYVEMLKAGYTAVGEFHYLHHQPDGSAYADPAELSQRVLAAAAEAGIGITHLPVLYAFGGFGGQPARPAQRRFLHGTDAFLRLVERLAGAARGDGNVRVGIAPHSLRAVTPAVLAEAIKGLDAIDPTAPIHIHIAEQTREVEECVAWSGRRPVEWLQAHHALGPRWCLVHATHMTAEETSALAAGGAVAGLCPTTEANLGDGLFPLVPFLEQGGTLGVGSDSHISVSPIEELRWLEYGQRLVTRERNVAGTPDAPHVGARLWRRALAGGAAAMARPIGALRPGARADLIVVDPDHPQMAGRSGDAFLDALVFAGNANPVTDVMVGGRWVVQAGRHPLEDRAAAAYRAAVKALAG